MRLAVIALAIIVMASAIAMAFNYAQQPSYAAPVTLSGECKHQRQCGRSEPLRCDASFSTRAAERDDDPLQRQTRREGSAVLSRFIKAIANMPPGVFGHKLGESMREWLLMLIPFALVFVLRGLSGSV